MAGFKLQDNSGVQYHFIHAHDRLFRLNSADTYDLRRLLKANVCKKVDLTIF